MKEYLRFLKSNWPGILIYFLLFILFALVIIGPKAVWTPNGLEFR